MSNKTETSTARIIPAAQPALWPLWLLIADAAAYWLALFYCVLLTLFYRDGAVGAGMRATGLLMAAVVVMLGFAARHILGQSWKRSLLLDALIFLFIGAWLPWKFSGVGTAKGLSFAWAAIEWWKLPNNVVLMFKTAPAEFIVFWAAVLFIIDRFRRGKRFATALIIIVFTVFYIIKLFGMEAGVRLPAYLFFALALIAALIAGWKGSMRAMARVLIIDGTFVFIFLFYLGVVPVWSGRPPAESDGFHRIYPAQGARAEFPLQFLRDMRVDPAAGYLYTAYGPTSGIVRVNIASGKADIIPNHGIVRVLWTTPAMSDVFALDWQYADFYRIGKRDFKIISKTDIHDDVLITPMSYEVVRDKLYVVSTDLPALTRFDLASLKREARIDFRTSGLTKFRSGAWKCVVDEQQRFLFVEMGPVDLRNRYVIAKIDLAKFEVVQTMYLPEGGLELTAVPWAHALLAPAFFNHNIYEVDMDSMKLKRTLKGPLTCRNLVVDSRRKMLYATGYTSGDLMAIDYESGDTVRSIKIGKKPSSLEYLPSEDKLYFGGSRGIYSLDLKKFLGEE